MPKNVPVPAGWDVVFEELFDTPVANGLPSDKWDYRDEWINQEKQSYVSDADNNGHVKVEPRDVDGEQRNVLVLRAAHEATAFPSANRNATGTFNWRSGGIQTRAMGSPNSDYTAPDPAEPRKGMPLGRYDIRVKLPTGRGSFPAAWLLGRINNEFPTLANGQRGWPWAGVLDIFEHLGREEADGNHVIHCTVHRSADENKWPTQGVTWNEKPLGFHKKSNTPWSAGWHVFRVDHFDDRIVWYIDGEIVNTINLNLNGTPQEEIVDGLYRNDPRFDTSGDLGWPWDDEFNSNRHLILNLAVGGNWAGDPGAGITEYEMLVDYVRVYAPSEQPASDGIIGGGPFAAGAFTPVLSDPRATHLNDQIDAQVRVDSAGDVVAILTKASDPLLTAADIPADLNFQSSQENDFTKGKENFEFNGERYVEDCYGKWWFTDEAIPEGSRIEENHLLHPTDFDAASWSTYNGAQPVSKTVGGGPKAGLDAFRFSFTDQGSNFNLARIVTTRFFGEGRHAVAGYWLRVPPDAQPRPIRIYAANNVYEVALTNEWKFFTASRGSTPAGSSAYGVINSGVPQAGDIEIAYAAAHDMTGRNNTAPPPWMVGLQWYNTTNPNRVDANNVVHDDVPTVGLPARRIDNLLESTGDLSASDWVKINGAVIAPDGKTVSLPNSTSGFEQYAVPTDADSVYGKTFGVRVKASGDGIIELRVRDLENSADMASQVITLVGGAKEFAVEHTFVSSTSAKAGFWIRKQPGADTAGQIAIEEIMLYEGDGIPLHVEHFGYSAYEYDAVVDASGVVTAQQGSRLAQRANGLRLGGPSTNMLPYSDDFAHHERSRVTVEGGFDGGYTKIKETAETGQHTWKVEPKISVTLGTTYCHSVVAKKGERNILAMVFPYWEFGSWSYAAFDLSAGTVLAHDTESAHILHLGGGEYLCWATDTATASTADCDPQLKIQAAATGQSASHAGVAGHGLYVKNEHFNVGKYPACFVPTNGAEASILAAKLTQVLSAPLREACQIRFPFQPLFSSVDDPGYGRLVELAIDDDNRIGLVASVPGAFILERKSQGQYAAFQIDGLTFDALDFCILEMVVDADGSFSGEIFIGGASGGTGERATPQAALIDGTMSVSIGARVNGTYPANIIAGELDITVANDSIIEVVTLPVTQPGLKTGFVFNGIEVATEYRVTFAKDGTLVHTLPNIITDTVGPIPQLDGPAGVQAGEFTVSVSFNEDAFQVEPQLVVSNGTVVQHEEGENNWTYRLAPAQGIDGTMTIQLPEGAFRDETGNPSQVSNILSIPIYTVVNEQLNRVLEAVQKGHYQQLGDQWVLVNLLK
jgi:beta-glucanase (GH16 family)